MSLKEMITKKRIQVLFFVILLILLNLTKETHTTSPDLLYVVKNANFPYDVACLANGNENNSGIGWIFPIPETENQMPETETTYIPSTYINNNYSCDFGNNKCSKNWLKDWKLFKKFEPVLDSRIDDFPTTFTSNSTEEFSSKFEISAQFSIGISIRSYRFGETLFCEGWNPYAYPCYYLNIGGENGEKLILKKFKKLPKTITAVNNEQILAIHEGDIITSSDEWRTYNISLDEKGTFEVTNFVTKQKLLTYIDQNMLKSVTYVLLRSFDPVLWKIHEIQYIHTEEPGITNFGPTLTLSNPNQGLCISFYSSMCNKCRVKFSLSSADGNNNFLESDQINLINYNEKANMTENWQKLELRKDNLTNSILNIIVKKEFEDDEKNPFWDISNVRVCSDKEIRHSTLRYKNENVQNKTVLRPQYDIVCQSLRNPTWRPPAYQSATIDGFKLKKISTEPKEILMQWDYFSQYQPYFLVEYKEIDKCKNENKSITLINRDLSFGVLLVREEEVKMNNLIPFTSYNISITDVINNKKMSNEIMTDETAVCTRGEIPRNVIINPKDTNVLIKWTKPLCNEIYGPIIYQMSIKDDDDEVLQIFNVDVDKNLQFFVRNLEPFHEYVLEILTARNVKNLNNTNLTHKNVYKFITLPGIAPKVHDLEVYEIDRNYARLRFKMADHLFGVPEKIKVMYCHHTIDEHCPSFISNNLTKCEFWDEYYCVEIENLIPEWDYTFFVSIQNVNTNRFGDSVNVTAVATYQKPGIPKNLKYKNVCFPDSQFCNVEITWEHPDHPEGIITAFLITLTESDEKMAESIEHIHKIPNREYNKTYTAFIKYIPYGIQYDLSVESTNYKYDQGFRATVKLFSHKANVTAPSIDAVNSSLIATFPPEILPLDTKTYVIVQENDFDDVNNENLSLNVLDIPSCYVEKCNHYGSVMLAKNYKEIMDDKNNTVITIENFVRADRNESLAIENLKANTSYCATVVVEYNVTNNLQCKIYSFRNVTIMFKINNNESEKEWPMRQYQKHNKEPEIKSASFSLPLSITFIVIALSVIIFLLVRRYRKMRYFVKRNRNANMENDYEELPFDGMEESVHNPLYDRLVHV